MIASNSEYDIWGHSHRTIFNPDLHNLNPESYVLELAPLFALLWPLNIVVFQNVLILSFQLGMNIL